jgi:hypothetical protein
MRVDNIQTRNGGPFFYMWPLSLKREHNGRIVLGMVEREPSWGKESVEVGQGTILGGKDKMGGAW